MPYNPSQRFHMTTGTVMERHKKVPFTFPGLEFTAAILLQRLESIPKVSADPVYVTWCPMLWCPGCLLQITDFELLHWKGLVAKCMSDYSSPECSKPNNKKLVWIVSRRTAQNLHTSYYSIPELPTIPEDCWDQSERYTWVSKTF